MEENVDNMNLIRKVISIRSDFSKCEDGIKKSGKNKFAGYEYFELEDIIPKAMELCEKYGVLPVVSFGSDLATMTIYDADSDQKMIITSPMSEAELKGCHPIQNTGAVETYSRRYLWFAFLEVVERDALDHGQEPASTPAGKPARTAAPSEAKPKDDRPASTFNPKDVWKEVLVFYGYDFSKPKDDKDNADALKAAHGLFDPYAKNVKDLTEEKGKAIRERLAVMSSQKGPEDFDDSEDIDKYFS